MNRDRHNYAPQDDDCPKSDYIERLLDRADFLRQERKDHAWEGAMEARGEAEEEERKLATGKEPA